MLTESEQSLIALSSEQAAELAGGYTLNLHTIRAIKAGADRDGVDEAYLTFSSWRRRMEKIWQSPMRTGSVAAINRSVSASRLSSLSLFDQDSPTDPDDLIGSLRFSSINPRPGRRVQARLSGSGSTYILTYSIR